MALPPVTAAVIERQSVSSKPPTGWTYEGCYTDSVSNRVLTGTAYTDSTGMTEESCMSFCGNAGYTTAGMEYACQSLR